MQQHEFVVAYRNAIPFRKLSSCQRLDITKGFTGPHLSRHSRLFRLFQLLGRVSGIVVASCPLAESVANFAPLQKNVKRADGSSAHAFEHRICQRE